MLRHGWPRSSRDWRAPFAACIAEGQAAGEIAATFAPDELADFLLASWQGAILRMKVDRSPEPLERFKAIAFATVFGRSSMMTPNHDVILPQRAVLGSTMAYRGGWQPGRAGRAVPARQSHLVLHLAQHHPARRTGRALRRAGPHRLRPVGQAGHRLSLRRSRPLSRRLHRGSGIASAYLVAQDWGSALAFHLAARRPELVRGLAFMEFIWPTPSWDEFHQVPAARETFRKFRTPGEGERLILEGMPSSSGCCPARSCAS